MKSFLLFLILGSAALYTLLVITDNVIANRTAENAFAGQTRANHAAVRRLSCWGPYLPSRSRGQERQASLNNSQQPTPRQQDAAHSGRTRLVLAASVHSEDPKIQFDFPGTDLQASSRLISNAASMPPMTEPKTLRIQSTAPDDPPIVTSPRDGDKVGMLRVSLPITGDTFEPSVPSESEEAIWFVVSRAARLHAGPSVSSAIVHFYPVGTELKLIGHEQGWFHISDPATSRQGWIYDKYYLEAIRGPGQTQIAVQKSPSPARVALETPEPKPVSRAKKSQQKIAKPRPQPGKGIRIASARIQSESFASLVERAFRGY